MRIHKEGYKIILAVLACLVAINVLLHLLSPIPSWSQILFLLISAILWGFTLSFFRVPVRLAAYAENKIFSGADGKVVVIEEVFEDEYFHEKRIQVSVFMNVTNVHVNFAPLHGVVKYFKYHPGKHLFAWLPKSSIENERTSLVIENKVAGAVLIRQIAGAFARRIVCYPQPEKKVIQGEEIGIIKFGSRVDVFLPLHAKIHVALNQHVKGAETLIASLP